MLLSGEYAVLDGAVALALPCKLGQSLSVKPSRGSDLIWISYNPEGKKWFEANISLYDFSAVRTNNKRRAEVLGKILRNAVRLNSEFLDKWNGFKVEAKLEFPLEWGLGSSSTLIYNIAQWADVNPFFLHFSVSNGSGYDIACAGADGPIRYELRGDELNYSEIDFYPSFHKQLYFIHLGNKVDSAESIKKYMSHVKTRDKIAKEISQISESFMDVSSLSDFQELVEKHECILSEAMGEPKVKDMKFPDFWSCIKSLGSWGGDFILATSERTEDETRRYFTEKGFKTIFRYDEIIHT